MKEWTGEKKKREGKGGRERGGKGVETVEISAVAILRPSIPSQNHRGGKEKEGGKDNGEASEGSLASQHGRQMA